MFQRYIFQELSTYIGVLATTEYIIFMKHTQISEPMSIFQIFQMTYQVARFKEENVCPP